ncbi:MAG: 4-carboxymuconolactone decarboxylase [Solirubrobacteraceae bacterium]|jgi:4-carboxymuconolactone decarboxylase|nr:4-carboxymuconolactone decarboxylase [Solirubrobacteraceae bacterium]
MSEETLFDRGMKVRRAVLGDAYVDRSLNAGTEFREPMQQLVTEFCWGAVWDRPNLDRRTRSLVNLGMLTALNRSTELAVHIRGAVNNGASKEEIQETLLQAAVYCGMPAGLESFRVAEKVFDDLAAEG